MTQHQKYIVPKTKKQCTKDALYNSNHQPPMTWMTYCSLIIRSMISFNNICISIICYLLRNQRAVHTGMGNIILSPRRTFVKERNPSDDNPSHPGQGVESLLWTQPHKLQTQRICSEKSELEHAQLPYSEAKTVLATKLKRRHAQVSKVSIIIDIKGQTQNEY